MPTEEKADAGQALVPISRRWSKLANAFNTLEDYSVRQLFGPERVEHPKDLYAQEWRQFTNHFRPTFNLLQREKKEGKTKRICENTPKTVYWTAAVPAAAFRNPDP